MKNLDDLFSRNQRWASEQGAGFFEESAKGQQPKYLWIGCSDSRIPAEVILGLEPGELFVHRNVANQFLDDDASANAVVEYAVGALGVNQIIVCGHYGCGGVLAAMDGVDEGWVGKWIAPLRNLVKASRAEVDAADHPADRMCEINALEQARKLEASPAVQAARQDGREVDVHAWVYSLSEGVFKDLNA